MKDLKIRYIINSGICIGCGFCAQICPRKAIDIYFDNNSGSYTAILDDRKCIKCNLCDHVCPLINFELNSTELDSYVDKEKIYLSYSNDKRIRYNAASGGTITQILLSLLDSELISGVLIPKLIKNEQISYEYFLANTKVDIINSMGSIYAPVSTKNIINIIKGLKKGSKIAIVGLPCILKGLTLFCKSHKEISDKIYIKIGLFCGRLPNLHATKYLLHKLNIKENDVIKINYRDAGWPGNMNIYLNNGIIKGVPYSSNLGMKLIFSSSIFLTKGCYFCNDPFGKYADISVGDAWYKKGQDKNGYSLLISLNDRGDKILPLLKGLYLKKVGFDKLLISQRRLIYSKIKGYKHRIFIIRLLNNKFKKVSPDQDINFSFLIFLRELIFLPYFITVKSLHLSKHYKNIPLIAFKFFKIFDKIWR